MRPSLNSAKIAAEIEQMRANAEKLRVEARQLNRDYGLAPLAAGAAIMAACTGLAALILRLFM